MQQPSYYSLAELIAQRNNCLAFGMDTAGLEHEIGLQAEYESEAGSSVNILPRPFDQERD
jgi:hypothetical protein